MLLTRNSGCKDKGFVLIDKDFRFFIIIGMFGAFSLCPIILLWLILACTPKSVLWVRSRLSLPAKRVLMVSVYSPVGSESGILNLRIWGSFISNGGSMQITSPFWWESWIASQTGLFPFSILILHPVTKTIPPGVIFPSICPVVRSVTRPICGVAFL